MKTRFPFHRLTLWGVLTAAIASLNFGLALGDDLPDSVRAQWKVKPEQVQIRWDSEKKILEFHLSEAKAIIHGPSNLYDQPYRISFHSESADAVVLLKLGDTFAKNKQLKFCQKI